MKAFDFDNVNMQHFYQLSTIGKPNDEYYIATDQPLRPRQIYSPATIRYIGVRVNLRTKLWSVHRNTFAINQGMESFHFITISKTDFIYHFNKTLVAIGSIDFE
jgi:hypothetical protein